MPLAATPARRLRRGPSGGRSSPRARPRRAGSRDRIRAGPASRRRRLMPSPPPRHGSDGPRPRSPRFAAPSAGGVRSGSGAAAGLRRPAAPTLAPALAVAPSAGAARALPRRQSDAPAGAGACPPTAGAGAARVAAGPAAPGAGVRARAPLQRRDRVGGAAHPGDRLRGHPYRRLLATPRVGDASVAGLPRIQVLEAVARPLANAPRVDPGGDQPLQRPCGRLRVRSGATGQRPAAVGTLRSAKPPGAARERGPGIDHGERLQDGAGAVGLAGRALDRAPAAVAVLDPP